MKKKSVKYDKLSYLTDYLFKMSYPNVLEKFNEYLPLSGGGTVTGTITNTHNKGLIATNSSHMDVGYDYNQATGALIALRSANYTNNPGGFELFARTVDTTIILYGKTDGTLKWGGNTVDVIVSSGSGYIRYSSGLQICYGRITVNCSSGGDTGAVWNFPLPFSEAPSIVCNDTGSVNGVVWIARASSPSTTSCRILLRESAPNGPWRDGTVPTIAIGRWK